MSLKNDNQELIDSAVKKYRPLLKALHIQGIRENPTVTKTDSIRSLFFSRCIIVTQQQETRDGQAGYFTFVNDTKNNLKILSIVLNKKLFKDEELETRIQRKAVGVHEFVHCVAVLMALSRLSDNPNPLIDELGELLNTKVESIDTDHSFVEIYQALSGKDETSKITRNLTNKHFELENHFDAFDGDYVDLYFSFLFSYDLFLETFEDNIKIWATADEIKKPEVSKLITETFNELVERKALYSDFAVEQFNSFVTRYFFEHPMKSFERSVL